MYYLGKEFNKSECKEYKTLDRALKAAAKDEELAVWNEDGQCIGSLQAGANGENSVDSDNTGNKPPTNETSQSGTEKEEQKVIVPKGKMKVTVICDGSLNLRRSAEWGNKNICGRATRGQSYYVKEIYKVNGRKMVHTIDDLYLSGESEFVQLEQV